MAAFYGLGSEQEAVNVVRVIKGKIMNLQEYAWKAFFPPR